MIPLSTIVEHASKRPFDVAVEDDAEWLTWGRLQGRVRSVCAWLTNHLTPDDENRMVVFADNSVPFVVVTAAAATLGLPWVGIDPARQFTKVREQFRAVEPTVVVTDTSLPAGAALAELAVEDGALVLDLAQCTDVMDYGKPGRGWAPPPFRALGFTSGTTGTPKLFIRTRKTENQRLVFLRDHFRFGPDDVYLVTSPLAHASGHVWANAALALGATVVIGDSDVERIVRTIERRQVTAAFMVPPVVDAVLEHAVGHPGADLSSLRALLTGGRHVSERTIQLAGLRLGEILHVYYATSETGINTMSCPGELARLPFTAGRPMPGVRLRVIDPVTRDDRPVGEVGLIAVASPMNMDGYVGVRADILWRGAEGYVVTSDYGYTDDDGRLFVVTRSDSLPGCGTVDVVRVESALKDVTGVADVCLVRRRTDDDVIEVVAAVRVVGDERQVRAAVRHRLTELLPDRTFTIVSVPRIPYNSAGKVDSRELDLLMHENLVFQSA